MFPHQGFFYDFFLPLGKWVIDNRSIIRKQYPDHLVLGLLFRAWRSAAMQKDIRTLFIAALVKSYALFNPDSGTLVVSHNIVLHGIVMAQYFFRTHLLSLDKYDKGVKRPRQLNDGHLRPGIQGGTAHSQGGSMRNKR